MDTSDSQKHAASFFRVRDWKSRWSPIGAKRHNKHEMREKLPLVGTRTLVSQDTFHHERKMAFIRVTDWDVETEKTAFFEGSGRGTTSQAEVTASLSERSSSHHSFSEQTTGLSAPGVMLLGWCSIYAVSIMYLYVQLDFLTRFI
jgi:hypothetical protein